jgi:hypothetical protein
MVINTMLGIENYSNRIQQTYLFSASHEPLVKSMIPTVGRIISPVTPLPTPLKNPSTPFLLAPDIGFRNTPDTPSTTPCAIKYETKLPLS